MGKLEISLVACAIVIVILATFTLYFRDLSVWQENQNESLRSQINTLQSNKNSLLTQVDDLEDNNTLLQSENENLQKENNELQDTNDLLSTQNEELQNQVDVLETEKTRLKGDISKLQTNYNALNQSYSLLNQTYENLEWNYTILEWEMEILRQVAEENKFMFYYGSLAKQRYGVDDLQEYLDRWEWVEGTYVKGVFDCSEMSAYIEWRLENEGYHTYIVCGTAPWGGGYHAWLLVETSEGHYMPVEATLYDIVYWSDPYFDNYFIYDQEFETIQDALEYNYEEFDWWAS